MVSTKLNRFVCKEYPDNMFCFFNPAVCVLQVPLLQVLMPCVLSPHSLRLQAALPGAAVHEHRAASETGSVQ